MNPEFRQTLNTISRNLETANEAAQENIYTFTQLFIDPCIFGVKNCCGACFEPCLLSREERLRRKRVQPRGRAEYDFDFYDDWDDNEIYGYDASNWGNDELDSLLARRESSSSSQPNRPRAMSYGARGRRKTHGQNDEDPTVIPGSSYLGFLERLPWKLGSRALKYKPSAAGLQTNPGGLRIRDVEAENLPPTIPEDSNESDPRDGHQRSRSDTAASKSTTNSMSSRGDLIIGDEEEDAVPIDDSFAVMLTRRTTEDSIRRPKIGPSRRSMRTVSSKSTASNKSRKSGDPTPLESVKASSTVETSTQDHPTILDLKREERQVQYEDELEIKQRREAAWKLARKRGLVDSSDSSEAFPTVDHEMKSPEDEPEQSTVLLLTETEAPNTHVDPRSSQESQNMPLASPISTNTGYRADSETEPFPSMPTTPSKEQPPPSHSP